MFATNAESVNVWKETGKGVFVFDHTERIRKGTMERVIIRAFGLPIDKAVEIVGRVGVNNMLKDQINGDDIIVRAGDCAVFLTTKNRKSIGIDVWKPRMTSQQQ